VYLKLAPLTALIAAPAFAGVAFVAQDLTELILPAEYRPVGAMLAIIASIGIFAPLNNPRNAVLTALGRLNLLLVLAVTELVTGVVALLIAANYGVFAALASMAVPMLVSLALSLPFVLKSCSVRIEEFVAAVWRPYVGVIVMSLILIALRPALDIPAVWRMAVTVIAGVAVYAGWLLLLSRQWTLATIRMSGFK
jgi:O-antigen/teichoic acid export membrane protein